MSERISKRTNYLFVIAGLGFVALFSMGVESCTEPKEYCKHYEAKTDQTECTEFCSSNKDFTGSPSRDALIRACELGQAGFLANPTISSAEALLGCDRQFADRAQAVACRTGVTAEDLRESKSRRGAGSSNDRETGNNR